VREARGSPGGPRIYGWGEELTPSGRQVAVTGIGLVCPLGESLEEAWRALEAGDDAPSSPGPYGECGARVLEARGFDPRPRFPVPKALKLTDRRTRLAVAAAGEALADAGLASAGLTAGASLIDALGDPCRVGVVLGSSGSDMMAEELARVLAGDDDRRGARDVPWFASRVLSSLNPLWLLINLPNMVSAHLAIQFGIRGPNSTVMTDWVAGLQAVGEGCGWIEAGEADVVLAGGAETAALPFVIGAYDGSGLFDPFEERGGPFLFGEGAAVLVLEELTRAEQRGARVWALLDGYSSAMPGRGTAADACAAALSGALDAAGAGGPEVGAVAAASVMGRAPWRAEREAIDRVFPGSRHGGRAPEILSFSPRTGFALGASGALDLALLLKSIAAMDGPERALCSSVGYSGQAACVAVRRRKET
jgi:3-oxoacyl-(acyl-carrier-protein) synthase